MWVKEAKKLTIESGPEKISLSIQSFGILPKIREVDQFITPELQNNRIREVHPELCFFAMNGDKPMKISKKKKAGRAERLKVLNDQGFGDISPHFKNFKIKEAAPDDIIDACAACWTAELIYRRRGIRIPEEPEIDSGGLRMEMWR
jgi:predicted RNase H-like nuclease